MEAWLYTFLSIAAISLLALLGGFIYRVREAFREPVLHFLLAFAAGTLLCTACLDLLVQSTLPIHSTGLMLLIGILSFFLLEGWLRQSQHEHTHGADIGHGPVHTHHSHETTHTEAMVPLTLLSDALHSVVDGILIAISFLGGIEIGISVSFAILIHELPHEVSKFGILLRNGLPIREALIYILLTQLAMVLGAVPTLLIGTASQDFLAYTQPLLAGCFFYLAIGNILPHLLHHHGQRKLALLQLGGLVLSLVVAAVK
jgi:zinc and cadmium transporter